MVVPSNDDAVRFVIRRMEEGINPDVAQFCQNICDTATTFGRVLGSYDKGKKVTLLKLAMETPENAVAFTSAVLDYGKSNSSSDQLGYIVLNGEKLEFQKHTSIPEVVTSALDPRKDWNCEREKVVLDFFNNFEEQVLDMGQRLDGTISSYDWMNNILESNRGLYALASRIKELDITRSDEEKEVYKQILRSINIVTQSYSEMISATMNVPNNENVLGVYRMMSPDSIILFDVVDRIYDMNVPASMVSPVPFTAVMNVGGNLSMIGVADFKRYFEITKLRKLILKED